MVKKSKKVSEETFAQLEDLCNEPAAPTEALKELMTHKKEKTFCPVCGGTGFVFVGETTCYAFMQSMGLVNDHINGCCCK